MNLISATVKLASNRSLALDVRKGFALPRNRRALAEASENRSNDVKEPEPQTAYWKPEGQRDSAGERRQCITITFSHYAP